jgi:hypothetical protein
MDIEKLILDNIVSIIVAIVAIAGMYWALKDYGRRITNLEKDIKGLIQRPDSNAEIILKLDNLKELFTRNDKDHNDIIGRLKYLEGRDRTLAQIETKIDNINISLSDIKTAIGQIWGGIEKLSNK